VQTSQGPSKQEYLQWLLNDENRESAKVSVFSEARIVKLTLPQKHDADNFESFITRSPQSSLNSEGWHKT